MPRMNTAAGEAPAPGKVHHHAGPRAHGLGCVGIGCGRCSLRLRICRCGGARLRRHGACGLRVLGSLVRCGFRRRFRFCAAQLCCRRRDHFRLRRLGGSGLFRGHQFGVRDRLAGIRRRLVGGGIGFRRQDIEHDFRAVAEIVIARGLICAEFDHRAAIFHPPSRFLHPGRRHIVESLKVRPGHGFEADGDVAGAGKDRIGHVFRPVEDETREGRIGAGADAQLRQLGDVDGHGLFRRRRRQIGRYARKIVRRQVDGDAVGRDAAVQAHVLRQGEAIGETARIGVSAGEIGGQALDDRGRIDRHLAVEGSVSTPPARAAFTWAAGASVKTMRPKPPSLSVAAESAHADETSAGVARQASASAAIACVLRFQSPCVRMCRP